MFERASALPYSARWAQGLHYKTSGILIIWHDERETKVFFLFCRCCSVSTFEFFKFCCCSPRIYSVQEQPSPLNFGNVQCKTCLLYSSAYKFKFNNDPANQRMNGREKKMCVLIWWAQNLKFIREANNLCVCRLRRIVVSLHFQLRDVGCCYCYYSSSTKYIYIMRIYK